MELVQNGSAVCSFSGGSEGIGGGDLVPAWFSEECVYKDFCQCNLVSRRHPGWHHPGTLYSNIISRRHQLFDGRCGCSQVEWSFPSGCNRHIKNVEIAISLCRVVMHVLIDAPPSVPQRGAPLVSVFPSRKFKPKWEARRLERLRARYALLRARRLEKYDDWESSEEGSVTQHTRQVVCTPTEEELAVLFVSRVALWRLFLRFVTSACVLARWSRLDSSYIAQAESHSYTALMFACS